jgi:monoamine oxidase
VYRPGHYTRLHDALSVPEGRLHFAGSDVSFGNQRWMEGALETAFQVVDRLLHRG